MSTTMTAPTCTSFTIRPRGPFSLEEAAMFGFGQRHDDRFDGTMRLAFCGDGHAGQAGVALTQDDDETIRGTITGTAGRITHDAIVGQVARVLSLDHDAEAYVAIGDLDPVVARLLAVAPGLRPPLFYSPYEAAFWSVLSARRSYATANAWRRRLSAHAGATFAVAGQDLHAVPTPAALLELGVDGCASAGGFEPARAERVIGVADAAARGLLDVDVLQAMDLDDARRQLKTIKGIGPFYADLILIRATGLTDVLTNDEPHVMAMAGELYGDGEPLTQAELATIAEPWRPFRTWVTVLLRAAGPRLRR